MKSGHHWLMALGVCTVLVACGAQTAPPSGVAVTALPAAPVTLRRTPLERRLEGSVEAVNQGTVAAQTSGRVAAILYDVNDFVPAGAVIVRLRAMEPRSTLAEAEAALKEAAARDAQAQLHFQRISELFERKVVPKASLDEATANRDSAAARLSAARAVVQSAKEGVAYTEIRAPFAGVVTKRLVQVGETVSPGMPLMSGLSLQFLRVAVDVPQSIIDQVRRTRQAVVYIDGRRIQASKVTIFPEAASPSNTFRARLELPENAADLYPGMFVKVGFIIGEADRLLVPNSCLVVRSEVTAVYGVDTHGRTSLRQVRLGDKFGDLTEVLAGLKVGDRIALDPLLAAKQPAASKSGSPL